MSGEIYLDSAATTPLDDRVLQEMMPYLTDRYGNPGSIYGFGRIAYGAIESAREQVRHFIGADHGEVIFTSGGSEANSLVFHGVKDHLKAAGKTHILVSAVEHDSVLKAADSLIKDGFCVERIPVQSNGVVDVGAVERLLRPETGLVSVMFVNNETGVENPVSDIGSLCLKRGVLFHTDCVQAAGCQVINATDLGCNFLTVSSHKIYGPKGAGALYVRDVAARSPLVYGGDDQELGLRGGTENVPGIVGFGAACALAEELHTKDKTDLSTYKQRFVTLLQEALGPDAIKINGTSLLAPGKTVNLQIQGVDNESLILAMDNNGVCISAGSACNSKSTIPSHVLTAMGLSAEQARSSIRVSFSRMNTLEEVEFAAGIMAANIRTLREIGIGRA